MVISRPRLPPELFLLFLFRESRLKPGSGLAGADWRRILA